MPILLAAAGCLQWMFVRGIGLHMGQPWEVILPGLAIVSAAFLLTWGGEAAEMDIPQNMSVGIMALIAVLPEYAVDMYFAWMAGKDPLYISYASANMTGANRLLIGVGWPCVLLAAFWKRGQKSIEIDQKNALDLVVLLAATLYSFLIPFKGTLSLIDSLVFISMFVFYAYMASKAEIHAPELEGTALKIASLGKSRRRWTIAGLFVLSATSICLAAEPFAEGLLAAGRHWGIEEYVLVQWLAPLSSEAPEFIVAILFALNGKAEGGLKMLVSSKVNQWTLLIGMLPATYSLSAGHVGAMHLDSRQAGELMLTSAQSLFGMVILMNLHFSMAEALWLLGLFLAQMLFPGETFRHVVSGVYLAVVLGMLFQSKRRACMAGLIGQCVRPTTSGRAGSARKSVS